MLSIFIWLVISCSAFCIGLYLGHSQAEEFLLENEEDIRSRLIHVLCWKRYNLTQQAVRIGASEDDWYRQEIEDLDRLIAYATTAVFKSQ